MSQGLEVMGISSGAGVGVRIVYSINKRKPLFRQNRLVYAGEQLVHLLLATSAQHDAAYSASVLQPPQAELGQRHAKLLRSILVGVHSCNAPCRRSVPANTHTKCVSRQALQQIPGCHALCRCAKQPTFVT